MDYEQKQPDDTIESRSDSTSTRESSRKARYRSIGIDFNQVNSPLKALLSNLSITETPNNTMISEGEQVEEEEELKEIDLVPRLDTLDELFEHQSKLNEAIQSKLQQLHTHNGTYRDLLDDLNQMSYTRPRITTLPTPQDDEEFNGKDGHYQSRYTDIPSSPESYESGTSQMEIELMDQISRFAQLNNTNDDIIRLKNVIHSTFDVLNFPIYEKESSRSFKLMESNDVLKTKSHLVMDKLSNLIKSFT